MTNPNKTTIENMSTKLEAHHASIKEILADVYRLCPEAWDAIESLKHAATHLDNAALALYEAANPDAGEDN